MKNKILSIIMVTVLTAASVSGCGRANENTQNKQAAKSASQTGKIDYSTLSEEELTKLYEKEPASKRTINVAYDGGLCLSAIPLAQYKGYFEEEGLKTKLVASGATGARDALVAKKIDTAVGMITDWVTAIQNGVEIQFTEALHTGCTSAAVLADSDIQGFKAGQKVAIAGPIGGFIHNIGLRFVAHDGFKSDDFNWLAMDSGTVLSALQKGEAEVIVAGDQLINQWAKDGLVRVIRSQTTDDDFKDEACCAFGFLKSFIEENPVTVYKISRALYKTSKWLDESDENKREAVDYCLENGYTSGDADTNFELLKSLKFGLEYEDLNKSLHGIVPEFVQLGILKKDLDQEAFMENLLIEYHFEKK